MTKEPDKTTVGIDAEYLSGHRFPYQEDISLVEDVDLMAATPGQDINWLEDVELLVEDGLPAVFDRYSNSFLKLHFEIPAGRENEIARKVLIKHLQSGNSYGIQLKEKHSISSAGPSVTNSFTPTITRRCSRAGSRPRTDFRRTDAVHSSRAPRRWARTPTPRSVRHGPADAP